ncbi:hypothetical protein BVRB_8g192770 [Beta vulgaris subsp. vulgaris]|nr:hypothetical protein BVRB_8g192770 [Beta vulgaris subsp. vulgaris]
MAGTGVGDGLFHGVFEGSISGSHLEIDRRPYHRNCTCALHDSSRGATCSHHKPSKVIYPIKRSWSEGSLAFYSASATLNPSPSSSPAIDLSKATPISRTSSSSTFQHFLCSSDVSS